jgi:hypothetical protein
MARVENFEWIVTVFGPLMVVVTFFSLLVAREIVLIVQPDNLARIIRSLDAAIVTSATMFGLIITLQILHRIDFI